MALITYYTKPGCATSMKQIELLRQAGHQIDVRDLIAHPWQAEELRSYFVELPVTAWFNPNSPRVKSGEIDPQGYDGHEALALMQADHLLIRRPLMESEGTRMCGFDPVAIHAWIGLGTSVYEQSLAQDFTSCSQPADSK